MDRPSPIVPAAQIIDGDGGSKPLVGDSYSAFQLRSDRWNALREIVEDLANNDQSASQRKARLREARDLFDLLEPIEMYWAFPGVDAFHRMRRILEHKDIVDFSNAVRRVARALSSGAYRKRLVPLFGETEDAETFEEETALPSDESSLGRPYFEMLLVDNLTDHQIASLKANLHKVRRAEDPFVYEVVVVPSLEDALVAILFNHNIQAAVVRNGLTLKSAADRDVLSAYLDRIRKLASLDELRPARYASETCRLIGQIRPEVDLYLVTDRSVEELATADLSGLQRVFYNQEDFFELHLNILRGVNKRYDTPFFTALKKYSRQPTGVFHALPISRGKSISRSHWIQDMGAFYGPNIFLAETSATSGGLDSLLEPRGPIKEAQELAARAFGAQHSFFVTNGTSTSNKIVVQALIRPGDVVLVDRDCHKSHHYGMVLGGAHVAYMDSYPLDRYSMYGAVPLREIKSHLLRLKEAGQLHRVRMVLLTNCTFDGLVYNVERVMEECLAIKKDLVFLWDEAWFGFARFNPAYRQRTAMHCAKALKERLGSEQRRKAWDDQCVALQDADTETWLDTRLVAPPDARVRVYSTQSTHKTLTSLRQGSMIHVYDQDYRGETEQAFHEAYMTHTSTSPNYQIIASLDVGRRQVELEGFEFVQNQIECAMAIRQAISRHPLLQKYFRVLTPGDMIPEAHRESGIEAYHGHGTGWTHAVEIWGRDEFVLDPTKITLLVGNTGHDGDTFKTDVLMKRYGIQVNKTSRNTVLFLTNIGTTRSSVAYLLEILIDFARDLDDLRENASSMERRSLENRVRGLMEDVPPLPDFSSFHPAFRDKATQAGDMRRAFFAAYLTENCDYVSLDGDLIRRLNDHEELVSAGFITPYPPGFPILVPGQVIDRQVIDFMRALDVTEIHGYRPDLGLRIFTREALEAQARVPADPGC